MNNECRMYVSKFCVSLTRDNHIHFLPVRIWKADDFQLKQSCDFVLREIRLDFRPHSPTIERIWMEIHEWGRQKILRCKKAATGAKRKIQPAREGRKEGWMDGWRGSAVDNFIGPLCVFYRRRWSHTRRIEQNLSPLAQLWRSWCLSAVDPSQVMTFHMSKPEWFGLLRFCCWCMASQSERICFPISIYSSKEP